MTARPRVTRVGLRLMAHIAAHPHIPYAQAATHTDLPAVIFDHTIDQLEALDWITTHQRRLTATPTGLAALEALTPRIDALTERVR